jgi:uncharacterized protein YuzE
VSFRTKVQCPLALFHKLIPESDRQKDKIDNMKFNYYCETESLYISLNEKPSTDSQEVSSGIVLDFDSEGNLVGIDIDCATLRDRNRHFD